MVADTELSAHSDDGVLSVIAATEKALSWLQAVQLRALAEFNQRRQTDEFAGEEIAAVLTLSPRTGINRLDWAIEVSRRLPRALAAMESGSVSYAQLRVMAEETLHLPLEDIPAVEECVLACAAGKTPGQVRRATKRAVLRVDPEAAVRREDKAEAERGVVVNPLPDGMAELIATLPAADAHALYNRIDELARKARDSRSMDQRRADTLVGLGQRNAGVAGKPLIQVVIRESTLSGCDNEPAQLVGYGPINARTARAIAADSIWQALRTDAEGVVTAVGRHRYRPSEALAELIRARDRHCRHYGCGQPRADIDHTIRYPDGPTTADNLASLCRRHHRMKHTSNRWAVTHKANGTLEWTSPTGRRYESQPTPYI